MTRARQLEECGSDVHYCRESVRDAAGLRRGQRRVPGDQGHADATLTRKGLVEGRRCRGRRRPTRPVPDVTVCAADVVEAVVVVCRYVVKYVLGNDGACF